MDPWNNSTHQALSALIGPEWSWLIHMAIVIATIAGGLYFNQKVIAIKIKEFTEPAEEPP